jgi:hypothetical protein
MAHAGSHAPGPGRLVRQPGLLSRHLPLTDGRIRLRE